MMKGNEWIVCLLSCCLITEVKAGRPKFIGSLQNVTVSEGRDATFTCTVTHLGGYRVAWIKSDTKAILAIHDHVITNNNRLKVTHNDKDTWTLLIQDVKQKDAGEYMCQVNSVPMVSQIATLEVVIPPQISDKHSTKDVSIAEGGLAKFICSATGHPSPSITWKKIPKSPSDRGKIRIKDKTGRDTLRRSVTGEVLSLSSVTREDMGAYMCIAKNGVPPAISKSFKLIVNFEPQIEVANQVVGAPTGAEIVLRCQIQASPRPITYWSRKSGGMIVPSVKYNISEESTSDYHFTSTLHIRSLTLGDFAQYSCVSKNTIGKSEESIELYQLQREIEPHTSSTRQTYVYYEEYQTTEPENESSRSKNGRIRHEQNGKLDNSSNNSTMNHYQYGFETGGIYRSHCDGVFVSNLLFHIVPIALLILF